MANDSSKKKWLTLSSIAIALLLIPRRSSQNAHIDLADCLENNNLETDLTANMDKSNAK